MKCAATTWVCVHVCYCACVCVCTCMRTLTHTCLNVCWGSDRLKLRNVFFFRWSCIFLGRVTWCHFITDSKMTAQERCKMQKDSNCTTNEMRNQRGAERMKTEDRRQDRGREYGNLTEKIKMIQKHFLFNASTPVDEKKKLSGFVVPKSSTCPTYFSERTWIHTGRLGEHFTLSTKKETCKSC